MAPGIAHAGEFPETKKRMKKRYAPVFGIKMKLKMVGIVCAGFTSVNKTKI